jgi:hypothetical protein
MSNNRESPMEIPLDDKFLMDRYDYELARKDKISDSLGLPVSVLIVLGGLVVTMVRGFSYSNRSLTIPFLIVAAIDGVAYAFALWYFAHAYHGNYEYERLPSLNDLFTALNDYRAYYDHDDEDRAMEDFDGSFRWRIIQAADRNATSNNGRQRCLHLAIVSLFCVIVATVIAAVPYGIDQVLAFARTPVMHIDNSDRKDSPMAQTPASTQTPPASRPQSGPQPSGPKPEFPANTVFINDQPVKADSPKK